jgi:hypothetical protein
MRFIQQELDRIGAALTRPQPGNCYAELYAAQQALNWALNQETFKSPFDMLVPNDTLKDLEDCQAGSGHSEFSDSRARHVS